jgi:hypothetical protein
MGLTVSKPHCLRVPRLAIVSQLLQLRGAQLAKTCSTLVDVDDMRFAQKMHRRGRKRSVRILDAFHVEAAARRGVDLIITKIP